MIVLLIVGCHGDVLATLVTIIFVFIQVYCFTFVVCFVHFSSFGVFMSELYSSSRVKSRSVFRSIVLFSSVAVLSVAVVAVVNGSGAADAAATGSAARPVAVSSEDSLSSVEVEGLVFMREEEKLARDVYIVLFEKWGLPIFDNISNAEQSHMDALAGLLEKYGLSDPIVDDSVGVFVNEELQVLFDDLVALGSVSKEDALEVGAVIEEVDIEDIAVYMAESSNEDLLRVYERLYKGSLNHLRAFVNQLPEDRVPVVLDEVLYFEILNAEVSRVRGGPAGSFEQRKHVQGFQSQDDLMPRDPVSRRSGSQMRGSDGPRDPVSRRSGSQMRGSDGPRGPRGFEGQNFRSDSV